jgi:hypothetical protein
MSRDLLAKVLLDKQDKLINKLTGRQLIKRFVQQE